MAARRPRPQHAKGYDALRALLRQMREDAGLTQRDLGKLLKIHNSVVHRCETGDRRIDPIELLRWAKACGADPVEATRKLVKRAGI
ncbi:MAG: helix-turn-helix domain-containing protein [Phycisphaerales bacterium JB058]